MSAMHSELQSEIIAALGVSPTVDPEAEIERRVAFLADYLDATGAKGFVLGISGGQDSTLAGRLAQLAAERQRAAEAHRTGANRTRAAHSAQRMEHLDTLRDTLDAHLDALVRDVWTPRVCDVDIARHGLGHGKRIHLAAVVVAKGVGEHGIRVVLGRAALEGEGRRPFVGGAGGHGWRHTT